MVRHIQHGGVVRGLLFQLFNGLAQEIVGVEQGIVIAIDDLLARAFSKVAGVAGGHELPESQRVTPVVSGPWLPS